MLDDYMLLTYTLTHVLYYTVLYCTVLYCIVLYCIILYYIILYYNILYYIILYCIKLYYIIYIYFFNFWADAHRRLRRITRPSISSQCGLESYWMRTCFRKIFLMFFGTNRNFVGNRQLFWEQVSSRKLLRRVFPKELLPISICYFV